MTSHTRRECCERTPCRTEGWSHLWFRREVLLLREQTVHFLHDFDHVNKNNAQLHAKRSYSSKSRRAPQSALLCNYNPSPVNACWMLSIQHYLSWQFPIRGRYQCMPGHESPRMMIYPHHGPKARAVRWLGQPGRASPNKDGRGDEKMGTSRLFRRRPPPVESSTFDQSPIADCRRSARQPSRIQALISWSLVNTYRVHDPRPNEVCDRRRTGAASRGAERAAG